MNTTAKQIKILLIATFWFAVFFVPGKLHGQPPAPVINRERGKEMLSNVRSAVKESYYDPNFHGVDIDEKFKQAEAQIKAATSTWQINSIIAEVMMSLDDSHTFFIPPELVLGVEYGFRLQIIGTKAYVIGIVPGSDAEKKGLKVGDEVHGLEGFELNRDSLWKLEYSFFTLLNPPSIKLTIRDASKNLKQFEIAAAVSRKKPRHIDIDAPPPPAPNFYELGSVIACRLRRFELTDGQVDDMMARIRPKETLILDLRGNHGGLVRVEQRLLGYFFPRDVKIGDEKGRKQTTERLAKSRKEKVFNGKVIVLIDSRSASAAEVFARIMQLEKRGTVIGDRSAGAVMTGGRYAFGFETVADPYHTRPPVVYGVSVTVSDLLMSDGKSLEKVGVTPDEMVIPSPADIISKRDPVLARAAAIAGVELTAEKAGTIFKIDPTQDDESTDEKDKH